MKISDKNTALITGASRGLGLALARALVDRNWELIIGARGSNELQKARVDLGKITRVWAIQGDISDPDHRRQLARVADETGGLDLIINNASFPGPSPQPALLAYPLETLMDVYKNNVIAPLGLLQAVQDQLKPRAGPRNSDQRR
jgi:NAD(P)-dependent dehydrogenase (short-subunit alcohol dehydrogenase family)